ncbi:hypothetical protein Agub_g2667 [Astrephomene gubernaculifera]|uniref:Isocitrate lyase n=1 Tax=Astrephomene gubernaculifera TaxID=47775 RepID=A0AAD3DJP3_9CHLO|nr:hypothetical protein Agub_g2667 [Astrephomene gubernaculifera]
MQALSINPSSSLKRSGMAGSARRSPWLRAAASGRRTSVAVSAAMRNSRTAELRKLLSGNEILLGPCCHDGLSARLIEQAGFPFAFMSGFCTAGARLGAPDTGLISYAEMVDVARNAVEATRGLPIIGDGDTGYGNAMNVKRTVRGYAQAGLAGILIEDQVAPKSCGHVRGKRVVGRGEAVERIRAAADARDEGADILIVARSDARQAVSLEEALWRAQAFAEAGADVLFIDALESEEEMRALAQLGGAAAGVAKMANMLEGGGKTPLLPPSALQALGFKLVAYPLSLLGVSVRAMQEALVGLKRGRVPPREALGSFADIQAAVGFPEYYSEEQRYAAGPESGAAAGAAGAWGAGAAGARGSWSSAGPAAWPGAGPSSASWGGSGSVGGGGERSPPQRPPPPPPPPQTPVVEPEAVYEGSTPRSTAAAGDNTSSSSSSTYSPYSSSSTTASSSSSSSSSRRNRNLRVRITDGTTGLVKLETRVPAGFLNGLTALVPQVAGFNIEALLDQALGPGGVLPPPDQPLLNLATGSDKIQIFLE